MAAKILFSVVVTVTVAGALFCMTGCRTAATIEKALNDAAVIATGPCAAKVAEALAVCRENPPLPPKK